MVSVDQELHVYLNFTFFGQGVSLARRFALVPLGPPLLAYKSNCKAMLKAVGDNVQLEVDRAYKAGDPISVWYVFKFSAYQNHFCELFYFETVCYSF